MKVGWLLWNKRRTASVCSEIAPVESWVFNIEEKKSDVKKIEHTQILKYIQVDKGVNFL